MVRRTWDVKTLLSSAPKVSSYRQLLVRLGLREAGGNYTQMKKYLAEYSVDISHFKHQAWNRGLRGTGKPRLSLQDILVKGSSFQSFKLKKRLFAEGIKTKACEECGWARVSADGYLPLELDHINGDRKDNRLENLRVLCPNCHSLKPTHRGKNKRRTKQI
jgi:5-methylcytosine-specific restriction endonuclease McrA